MSVGLGLHTRFCYKNPRTRLISTSRQYLTLNCGNGETQPRGDISCFSTRRCPAVGSDRITFVRWIYSLALSCHIKINLFSNEFLYCIKIQTVTDSDCEKGSHILLLYIYIKCYQDLLQLTKLLCDVHPVMLSVNEACYRFHFSCNNLLRTLHTTQTLIHGQFITESELPTCDWNASGSVSLGSWII